MPNLSCPRGFTNTCDICNHVADETRKCDSCSNLTYESGMLTCKLLFEAAKEKADTIRN